MSRLPHFPLPIAAALAVAVGTLVAVQSRINGQLATYLGGDGIWAATISLGFGLLLLLVAFTFLPSARHSVAELPGLVRTKVLRPWELFGGIAGAMLVAAQGIVVPRAGVAPFTVSSVAGQTANSVVVDKFGLAPGGKRAVTWQRVVAALLAVLAVGLAVVGRSAHQAVPWLLVALPLVAGALSAFQQAFNAKVAVTSASTLAATLVNFVVAVGSLFVAVGVEHLVTGKPLHPLPPIGSDGWLYLGGPLGAIFIFVGALTVSTLGVLLFGLAAICGQLFGAVLIDIAYPTHGAHVGWQTLTAVLLTGAAVGLAALSGRQRTSEAPRPQP